MWWKKKTGVPHGSNFQIHQDVFYLTSQLEIFARFERSQLGENPSLRKLQVLGAVTENKKILSNYEVTQSGNCQIAFDLNSLGSDKQVVGKSQSRKLDHCSNVH